jgi:hypothetical protein
MGVGLRVDFHPKSLRVKWRVSREAFGFAIEYPPRYPCAGACVKQIVIGDFRFAVSRFGKRAEWKTRAQQQFTPLFEPRGIGRAFDLLR